MDPNPRYNPGTTAPPVQFAPLGAAAPSVGFGWRRPSLRGRCDRRKDRGRLREGGWHVECYDQDVRREKDVTRSFSAFTLEGRRLRSALFFFARCQLCHSSESAGVLAQLAWGLARPVQLEGGMDTKPSDTRPVDSDLELAVFGAP
jgi:hypothetical protein